MPLKKNLEQHIEYLEETVKLSLWVTAEWKKKLPNESFEEIIHNRTPLVTHTVFNPGALYDPPSFKGNEWPDLRLKLKDIYHNDNNSDVFEERGFELIKEFIRPRAQRDLIEINNHHSESWIVYDLTAKSKHFDNSYLEIHMENSLYPKSFLSDNDYFYSKLKPALKDAEKHGFLGLWTFS